MKGICAPGCATYSRHQLDELTELAKSYGAKGLVSLALKEDATSTSCGYSKLCRRQVPNLRAN